MIDPLLLDLPEAFESERLILRAPRPTDAPLMYEAIVESLEALRPWMPWAQTAPTLQASERAARTMTANFALRADLPFILLRKEDGAFVGGSGLHRMDWSVPRFEIGYWCRTGFARRGYASEAARAVAKYAFEVLSAKRVEIYCDARNEPSRRVAARAGFRLEATLEKHRRALDGTLSDSCIFALTS